jgi:murein DD-endopeptidase MepM/ murein hydrolase activator NlpD
LFGRTLILVALISGGCKDGDAGEIATSGPRLDVGVTNPAPSSVPPGQAFAAEGLSALEPAPRTGWPVESVHLTSYFGWRVDPVTGKGTRLHRGIDLRGRPGDLVMSIAPGRVAFVGNDSLLGNMVVIDHGLGIESYYGHLTDVLVHSGLQIEQGTAIGTVGNTGRSQAPHLHLSIKIGDVPVDPLAILRRPLDPSPALARELPAADDQSDE